MKSVAELCRPRPNVFVDTARDDVLNLSDLIEGNIDPNAFFEENFRTKGMNILFQTVFNRFMGKSETGVIRLTQAMGGGKTHNMLALALLAQNPSLRTQILGDTYDAVGPVRVLAFSGRESDAEFGVWGSLAECYAAFYRSYRLQEYGKLKSHFPIYWLFVRAVFYSTFFIPYQRVSDIKIMSHIDVCHGFRYFCIKKQRKNSTFHSRLFLCPARHSTKETATKAMIRKKLLNFKLKLPFFVSDNELERFRASAVPFRERCPFCGARGNCRFYASYERSIVDIVDGKPCWRILKVVRILCACGHTHALLPDFVVPYKQYTLLFILHILHLYFSHSMTVQKLCDTFWISPPTLYEWKRAFALHRSWWPEFVRSGRKDSLDAIIFFLSRPVFSDFTSGFWQQTLFSFLQTHANPANCCRLPPGW